jgi:hypothetical protein
LRHDILTTAVAGRSRWEWAHAIIVFKEFLVGCMVALMHYAIGDGEGRAPSGRQAKAAAVNHAAAGAAGA